MRNSVKSFQIVASVALLCLMLAPDQAVGGFIDLGTSGWEYEASAGVTLEMIVTNVGNGLSSEGGGTTSFLLKKDFGISFVSATVRFKAKDGADQRQHFFMMSMVLQHSVDWSGVNLTMIEHLGVNRDIDDDEHPDRAHIHTMHGTDGGPNNDGLTPNPNTRFGVATADYLGPLAANDAWEPERLRLHDMSSSAYLGRNGDADRRGPMDFTLVITPVPEPSSVALLASGLLGLIALVRRRGKASNLKL